MSFSSKQKRLVVALALTSLVYQPLLVSAQQTQFKYKRVVPELVVTGSPTNPTDPVPPSNGTKILGVSSNSLNFTGTQVGDSSAQSVVLNNTGTGVVTLSSTELADIKHFGLSGTCGATLAPGANCLLTVQFNPHLAGRVSNSLVIASDAGTPINVNITGNGLQGTASFDKTELTFGVQDLNTTSTPKSVVISNTGTGPLQVTGISVAEGLENFNQNNNCSAPLSIGASCTVNVALTPTVTGPLSGRVLIDNNGSTGADYIQLSGAGATGSLVYAGLPIAFGKLSVSQSATRTFTLTNESANPISTYDFTFWNQGANYNHIQASQNCSNREFAPGESCTVTVSAAPHAAGAADLNILNLRSNSANSTPNTIVSYHYVNPTGTVAATSFGSHVTADNTVLPVTLTNSGEVPMIVTAPTAAAITAGGTDFSFVSTDCGGTLAIGQSCSTNVKFKGTDAGTRTGTLSVTTDGGAMTGQLTGVITQGTVTASPVTLTDTVIGQFTDKAVTITNSGTAALSISGISLAGTNPAVILQSNTCGSAIAPSGTCVANLKFTPTVAGAQPQETLLVSSDGVVATKSITINGNAIDMDNALQITPSTAAFGSITQNTSSTVQVSIKNKSTITGNLSIGSFPAGFAQGTATANPCGATLAANTTCSINVTFTPTATQAYSANLPLTWGPNSKTVNVPLTGTGSAMIDDFAAKVSLKLHFNGNFADSSATNPKTVSAAGSVTAATANSGKFSQGAVFTGSSSATRLTVQNAVNFGTGNFALEFFVKPSSYPATGFATIFDNDASSPNKNWFAIHVDSNGAIVIGHDSANKLFTANGTLPVGVWTHVALVRSGTMVLVFANGIQKGGFSIPSADAFGGNTNLFIGGQPAVSTRYFSGALDEVRITVGAHRYSSNFTPPAAEFP